MLVHQIHFTKKIYFYVQAMKYVINATNSDVNKIDVNSTCR